MMEVKDLVSPQAWAEQTYGAAQPGHVARTRRAVVIATAMAAEPAGSVPAQQQSQAATKAVYRFCENAHVSYEALMQPHWQQTRADASRDPRVLLVQDTTQVCSCGWLRIAWWMKRCSADRSRSSLVRIASAAPRSSNRSR